MRAARTPRRLTIGSGGRALVALVVLLVLAGCAQTLPGRATAAPDPLPAAGSTPPADGVPQPDLTTDEASAATTAAVQEIWRRTFPTVFNRSWTDISGFVPVRTADPDTPTPPCLRRTSELEKQAFYCPSADIVAWDADGLLPPLRDKFGVVGVVVVLAHEMGHAVHTRLGITGAGAQARTQPTILLEAIADCFAGFTLAELAKQPVTGLPAGPADRDAALQALVGFRDPIGIDANDASAHGNAFDRVSAFQSGYTDGAARCAGMTLENTTFTQRRFGSADDLARGGDLALPELLDAVGRDARAWFGGLAAARAPGYQAPELGLTPSCSGRAAFAQGPALFCAADGSVSVEPTAIAAAHKQFGDYAAGVLVAGRYAVATLNAIGMRTTGPQAGAAALCLSGAYTGRLIDGSSFSLSPGDLDEAMQVLLAGDWAARDSGGQVDPADSGFNRVERFRGGLLDGPDSCLPNA